MANPSFQTTVLATIPAGVQVRTITRSGVDTQIVGLDLNPGGPEQLMNPAVGLPVTVLSGDMTISPGTTAMPFGIDASTMFSGVTPLVPKFAAISASASGDNTLVASVVGKKIRVVKYTIVSGGTVSAKFKSGAGADLSGPMPLVANSGVGGGYCPVGHFETASGAALVLNLSAGVSVAGHATYLEV